MNSEALLYGKQFYEAQVDGSRRSARAILAKLYEFYRPRSVVDVGCGRGAWLAAAKELGSTTLSGFDGPWMSSDQLVAKGIDFTPVDLSRQFEIPARYDLCISVEVAEHLTSDGARRFIDTLCRASDVVLFSAAVPYQGGMNHVNERWQSFWVELFAFNDFECVDGIRPFIWARDDVDWWYRQNLLLFVDKKRTDLAGLWQHAAALAPIHDVVHPVNYEVKARKAAAVDNPSFRFCLSCFKRYLLLALGGRSLAAAISRDKSVSATDRSNRGVS